MQHHPRLSRRLAISAAIKKYSIKTRNKVSQIIGIPKSSVYRESLNRQNRINEVGHDFFETEAGTLFLSRLMVSAITVFGIKENVGAETISLFLKSAMLSAYVACSPSKDAKSQSFIKHTPQRCVFF